MGTISRTSGSTGDIWTAAEWNTQFDTPYNEINGNLEDVNIAGGAAIDATKIGNGDVTNTELSLLNSSSDWASYTPTATAFGTISNVNVYWTRIGNILKVQGTFTCGTVQGSTGTISLPSGLTSSGNYGATSNTKVGTMFLDATGGVYGVISVAASASTVGVGFWDRTTDNNAVVPSNVSGWIAGTPDVSFEFTVML